MRTAFIKALINQARRNPRIFLVVGDIGYSVVEPFAQEFPDRFLNAGVAEQNMTGVAAGLASEGYHVFTYSIANFPTLRCLEQVRNDVCHHNLSVTVVAVGAGLAYGNLGYSHHAVQDIACLRGLPNMTIYSPCDGMEVVACIEHILARLGPSYLRIGKAGETAIHSHPVVLTGPVRICGPADARLAVVGTGSIIGQAKVAAERLAFPVAVYSMPILTLEPEALEPLWRHHVIFTLEEHQRAGGLGEMVASHRPVGTRQQILAVNRDLTHSVGPQADLRREHGIDAETITRALEIARKEVA